MKKDKLKFIIPGVVVFIAVIALVIAYNSSTKIKRNSATAVGNTPGNLQSGGLFCENNGVIYFANPYDNNKLYSMNSDCSNIKCINDDSVSYINSKGRYIYYVKNNSKSVSNSTILRGEIYGVVRCRLNGSQYETLHTSYSTNLSLTGNTLVFGSTYNSKPVTYTVDISGKNKEIIYDNTVNNASVYDGHLYYSRPSEISATDHAVYDMRLSDGTSLLYCDANTYLATVVDNVLYYIDLGNNYALTAVDLATNTRKVLTTDRVVRYNVYRDLIYYQEESYDHSLMRMNKDGSNPVKIVDGDVSTISCTSKYTFFQMADTHTLYRVETYGEPEVQKFIIE